MREVWFQIKKNEEAAGEIILIEDVVEDPSNESLQESISLWGNTLHARARAAVVGSEPKR